MSTRVTTLLLAMCALTAGLHAQNTSTATGPTESTRPTLESMLTTPSLNVFRRFSGDRAKEIEFYGDVLALPPLATFGMPGGGQMTRFHAGTSEVKLTAAGQRGQDRPEPTGDIRDVTGLRVFTFFFPDEAALSARFKAHNLPVPDFRNGPGKTRAALVKDPDDQWVELVITPGAAADMYNNLEVGLTVSDLEKSRAFYLGFVGLPELPVADTPGLGKTYRFSHGTTTIKLWAAAPGAKKNTYTAGIQYVTSNVDEVDARAKANHITITQPLGMFGQGLKTVWLADPDGITNYFAQIIRSNQP